MRNDCDRHDTRVADAAAESVRASKSGPGEERTRIRGREVIEKWLRRRVVHVRVHVHVHDNMHNMYMHVCMHCTRT